MSSLQGQKPPGRAGTRLSQARSPSLALYPSLVLWICRYLRLRVCRQKGYPGQAQGFEMGQATGEERDRAGSTKISSFFFAPCPMALGSEGACLCWARQLFAAGCITCRGALASYKSAAGNFSFSFAWITLVLCLAISAGRAVWVHITYRGKCALIGQELVPKCQGKIYFPAQPLQVLIFLWAAR